MYTCPRVPSLEDVIVLLFLKTSVLELMAADITCAPTHWHALIVIVVRDVSASAH